jgi:hypothetical protein
VMSIGGARHGGTAKWAHKGSSQAASGERSSDNRIKTAAVVGQQTLGLLSNQA